MKKRAGSFKAIVSRFQAAKSEIVTAPDAWLKQTANAVRTGASRVAGQIKGIVQNPLAAAFGLTRHEIVYNQLTRDYFKTAASKVEGFSILAIHGLAISSAVPYSYIVRDLVNNFGAKNDYAVMNNLSQYLVLTAGVTVLNGVRTLISKNAIQSLNTHAKKKLGRVAVGLSKQGIDLKAIQVMQRLTDIENFNNFSVQLGLESTTSLIGVVQFGALLLSLYPPLLAFTVAYCAADNYLTYAFTKGLAPWSNQMASLQDKSRVAAQYLGRNPDALKEFDNSVDEQDRVGRRINFISSIQDSLTTVLDRGAMVYPYLFGMHDYFKDSLGVVQQQGDVARGFLAAGSIYRRERDAINKVTCSLSRLNAFLNGKVPDENVSEQVQRDVPTHARKSVINRLADALAPFGNLPHHQPAAKITPPAPQELPVRLIHPAGVQHKLWKGESINR